MCDYVLKTSKDKNLSCFIIYMKGSEISKRRIKVTEIKDDYIKAYCYFRKQPRIFKTENILSASLH